MRVLDLFSGVGGFSLGLERAGMKTVAFCEIEPFCRAVLRKHWPDVPQFEDVRKLRGEDVGPVDLVCGGYPCQPFSTAGKRGGAEDDRHLWPEMFRIISELRPTWVLGENVAGHITLGLDEVLSDLDALGYASRAFVIPACAVDAPHRRDRVWIVANANSQGLEGRECGELRERGTKRAAGQGCASVRNATSARLQDRWEDPERTRNLNDQVGGLLTPEFVEWLMGFETGWTALEASEIALYRKSRKKSAGQS